MSSDSPVAADGREHRLHWLSLFISIGSGLRHIIGPLIVSVVATRNADWLHDILPAVIVGLSMVASVIKYFSFRFRYDDDEMVIRSGIIRRNERHIPYARIQNIDASANVIERLFGVTTVSLQTGEGRSPEGEFQVLPESALAEMRSRVFARRTAIVADEMVRETNGDLRDRAPGTRHVPTATSPRTLLHLTTRDLLLCGFIENRVLAVLASLALLSSRADRLFRDERIISADRLGAIGATGIILGLIAAIVGVRIASTLWEVIHLHDFRLTRDGDDLRTTYGLLTRVSATIPLKRIQSVAIEESMLHRLFGRASVHVSTAGGGIGHSGKGSRELLAPIIPKAAVSRILHELNPEADLETVDWRATHPGARGRMMRRWIIVTSVIALGLSPLIHWWALAAEGAMIVIGLIRARMILRNLGLGLLQDGLIFRSGVLRRDTIVARFARIQAVQIDESPIDRWTGMATLTVDTAGATPAGTTMPFLRQDEAGALRQLIAARAESAQFVW